jgi:hypothetical protein
MTNEKWKMESVNQPRVIGETFLGGFDVKKCNVRIEWQSSDVELKWLDISPNLRL